MIARHVNKFLVFSLLSLVFLNFSFAQDKPDDEIVVCLETECPLSPLYLLPLNHEQTSFAVPYVQQLEKVLQFDLGHNGSTFLAKRNPSNDKFGATPTLTDVGPIAEWKSQNIPYVVKGSIKGQTLTLAILNTNTKNLISTDEFPLSGDLNQDRRQVHRAADLIHKALFGTQGIASTKILYTVRMVNKQGSENWTSEIWEADYDGANSRQISQDKSYCITPTYIPPKPGFSTGGLHVCFLHDRTA